MSSPAGDNCKECVVGEGCAIYANAPKRCLQFDCAYVQMNNVSIKLRPDNCHVVFEKLSDRIFLGTLDPDHKMTKEAIGQIRAFNDQGFSVVLNSRVFPRPKTILAEGHSYEDIDLEYTELLKEWRPQYIQQISN